MLATAFLFNRKWVFEEVIRVPVHKTESVSPLRFLIPTVGTLMLSEDVNGYWNQGLTKAITNMYEFRRKSPTKEQFRRTCLQVVADFKGRKLYSRAVA